MYKSGNELEQFSELFVYNFGRLLGLNMAEYERDGGYIRSRDFTQGNVNFEPIYSVMLDEEDYPKNYRTIRDYSARAAAEYVGMVYLDALVLNMDCHTNNYGFLREPDSGDILSLAPLFDHNISLVARGYPTRAERRGGLLQKLFVELMQEEPQTIDDFRSLSLRRPSPEIVSEAIEAANTPAFGVGVVRADFLESFLLCAQSWLEEEIPQLFG